MRSARSPEQARSDVASLVDCIATPAAIYRLSDDKLWWANQRFNQSFAERATRATFLESLQAARSGQGGQLVAHHLDRRWYALEWSDVTSSVGQAAELVVAMEVTAPIDELVGQASHRLRLFERAQQMSVAEMASTLAHELKQPLATAHNYMEIAQRGLKPPRSRESYDDALEACERADTQVLHACSVIEHIRNFVQTRSVDRQRVDLVALVRRVVDLLALVARRAGVRIDVRGSTDVVTVQVDPVMIEQVLSNLLRNAIEAIADLGPERRAVEVTVERLPYGEVAVAVADRGPGLPEHRRTELFRAFDSAKPTGMGIGLAICRSVIELHCGRFFFEDREGQGTVFTFALPTVEYGLG